MRRISSFQGDRGVSLVLIALSLMMLVGAAALAVDLAALRYDLRAEQLAADAAATAGAIQIDPVSGSDAQSGCQVAWQYLLLNLEDEGGTPSPPDCSTFAGVCSGSFRSTTASAGPYDFVIGHPVPDDHEWMSEQTINDDIDGAACQRLGVSIERTRAFTFGRVLGFDDTTTTARSVARIAIKPGEGELVPLLLLEPISCDALIASGQGAITVEFFNDVPGIIAVDSDGSKTSNPNRCGNNQYTINANDNSLNWIRALPVPGSDPVPSAILSYALSGAAGAVPAHAYDPADVSSAITPNSDPPQTWFRLYPQPTPTTRRITRAPIDWRYNCKLSYPAYPLDLASPGVGIPIDPCPNTATQSAYIDQLRSPGQYGGTGNPTGFFQRWTDTYPCSVTGPITESGNWWIDCPGGFIVQAGVVTFQDGDLVFDGPVDVRSFGELHVNPSPSADHIVFIRSGGLIKGAQSTLTMRQTFVYLATGGIDLGGGAGPDTLIWTAPLDGNFEDLALWAEAPLGFNIGGQSGNSLEGTFFTPMAIPFSLTGQGGQFQTHAQFLTRRLEVKGQGEVRMTPDPDRSTRIPIRGVMLIR